MDQDTAQFILSTENMAKRTLSDLVKADKERGERERKNRIRERRLLKTSPVARARTAASKRGGASKSSTSKRDAKLEAILDLTKNMDWTGAVEKKTMNRAVSQRSQTVPLPTISAGTTSSSLNSSIQVIETSVLSGLGMRQLMDWLVKNLK